MKKNISIIFAALSILLVGCQKEKVKPIDDLVGKWELTNFKLTVEEDGTPTTDIDYDQSYIYCRGYLDIAEEGTFESDIHDVNNLQLAYFTFGYAANNLFDDGGVSKTKGTWRRLSDKIVQFDTGIPELLTTMGGEGHTVETSVSGDQLTVRKHSDADLAYFGYYAGYLSICPTYFSNYLFTNMSSTGTNAIEIRDDCRSQDGPTPTDQYNVGFYYGYYMGYLQGQIDGMYYNGSSVTDPLTYGLLMGTLESVDYYYDLDNSGTDFEDGYNAAYDGQYDQGYLDADDWSLQPAKTFTLEYKFSKQ